LGVTKNAKKSRKKVIEEREMIIQKNIKISHKREG